MTPDAPPRCDKCGAPVKNPSYRWCRDCWLMMKGGKLFHADTPR